MTNYRTKQPTSDVLVKMSGGLVVLAVVLVLIGMPAETYEIAAFGAIIGGIGVVLGLVGVILNLARR